MIRRLIVTYVGCRFLVVDSKSEAIGFYEKAGFCLVDSEKNRQSSQPAMFLNLNKITLVEKLQSESKNIKKELLNSEVD